MSEKQKEMIDLIEKAIANWPTSRGRDYAEQAFMLVRDCQPEQKQGEFVKEFRKQHDIIKYDLRFRPAAREENEEFRNYYSMSKYIANIEELYHRLEDAKKEIERLKEIIIDIKILRDEYLMSGSIVIKQCGEDLKKALKGE